MGFGWCSGEEARNALTGCSFHFAKRHFIGTAMFACKQSAIDWMRSMGLPIENEVLAAMDTTATRPRSRQATPARAQQEEEE